LKRVVRGVEKGCFAGAAEMVQSDCSIIAAAELKGIYVTGVPDKM
jgi:hypothetical protein